MALNLRQPDRFGLPLSPSAAGPLLVYYPDASSAALSSPELHWLNQIHECFNKWIVDRPGEAILYGWLDNIAQPHWYCDSPVVVSMHDEQRLAHCGRYNPVPNRKDLYDLGWRCAGYEFCRREYPRQDPVPFSIITPNDIHDPWLRDQIERGPGGDGLISVVHRTHQYRDPQEHEKALEQFSERWHASGQPVETIPTGVELALEPCKRDFSRDIAVPWAQRIWDRARSIVTPYVTSALQLNALIGSGPYA
ncbi:hypothetical protein MMC10_004815 [Thelotrema lepadinum]|nr:hypothetical protein [Thelotrema lepadinum]